MLSKTEPWFPFHQSIKNDKELCLTMIFLSLSPMTMKTQENCLRRNIAESLFSDSMLYDHVIDLLNVTL